MMKTILPTPEIVGLAAPADFGALEDLARTYAVDDKLGDRLGIELHPDGTALAAEPNRGFSNPIPYAAVVKAIGSFIHPVQEELFAVGDPIQVEYDRNHIWAKDPEEAVEPWRTDSYIGSQGFGIIVSDALATEFATGILKGRERRNYLRAISNDIQPDGNNPELDEIVTRLVGTRQLQTTSPSALQIASFTGETVHRPATNPFPAAMVRRSLLIRTVAIS
jgi:hypothetical protein